MAADAPSSDSEEMGDNLEEIEQELRERMLSARERLSSMDQGPSETCGPFYRLHLHCRRIAHSPKFTFTVAAVILCNVASMCLEVDYPNFVPGKECPMKCMGALTVSESTALGCPEGCAGHSNFWSVVNHTFLFFFSVELLIRLLAYGSCLTFFCDTRGDQGWNIFDFVIVLTCWMIWYFQSASGGGQYINLLRSLRMLRMLRVLRIFRVAYLKKLNIIIAGLIESIPSGFWVACMLGGVMFVSAIFCTDLIGKNADQWPVEDRANIQEWFGSMSKSMDTLFQFLTLADWSSITRVVAKESPEMMCFFLAYVIFAAMVILSLLTGVLADHVNTVTTEAEEEEKKERAAQRTQAWKAEFKAFKKATSFCDHRSQNAITRQQFRKLIKDKDVQAMLEELGISFENVDIDDLFYCMDRAANGVLCFHEFQAGMEELRLGVNGKQVFKLEVALRNAVRRCDPNQEFGGEHAGSQEAREHMTDANSRLDEIQVRMETLLERIATISPPPGGLVKRAVC